MNDRFIGLISGTSLDGVDAALVEFGAQTPRLIHALSLPYDEDLLTEVRAAADPDSRLPLSRLGALDARLGAHFAQAALRVLQAADQDPANVQAIGSHGQTVAHVPDGPFGFSWQLADPNRIAERTGLTTVADFRRRDIAAAGQGAPLTSAFNAAMFHDDGSDRAVLNLGGIGNLTLLPAVGPVAGFDCGPANCLLDGWARRYLNTPHDEDGDWAATGRVDEQLLQRLLGDPYFVRAVPKTTGTQYFHAGWLLGALGEDNRRPEDVAATLVELTARSVAHGLALANFKPDQVIVCGGGVHNTHLMVRIKANLPGAPVGSSAEFGVAPDWAEAIAFAWLARETLAVRPGNLPSVTGARGTRVLGGVYSAS